MKILTPNSMKHRLLLCCLLPFVSLAAPTQPNLIFLMADDCTYTDLGVYGGQAFTPNLDRLARQGMRFDNCWQTAPMCAPTRMNILTGTYPVKSGAYPNHSQVDPEIKSVFHFLKPVGYRIAMSGKTHISPRTVFDFEYYSVNKDPDFTVVRKFIRECQNTDTPFCLFLMSNHPHDPWDAGDPTRYPPDQLELPPHWVDTPETRDCYSRYLAEITEFDREVGQTMTLLDQEGLADDTALMVASEQGSAFPFAKWTCYAEGLRSGMIVRWPGQIKPDATSQAMVEYSDILPTLLSIAAVEPTPSIQGKSFLPVLRGETNFHKNYTFGIHTSTGIKCSTQPFGIRSVRDQRYSYIRNLHPNNRFQNVINNNPDAEYYPSWKMNAAQGNTKAAAKILRYEQRPAEELYDRKLDPLELNNLADLPEYTSKKEELSQQLDSWMRQQGDQGCITEENAAEHYATWYREKLGLPD
ncbi:sulfatase family protein [Pontiella sulfatireligans]|uniref:Choline-sulfatase n=1 Tax=Pontiella sulfatireligans TaxID=2750658 RepID=A0A6C2UPC0_9BACT|nr:sulfatase [Pontiella sulfatireligans]SPS74495.1 sulfatase S1_8 [Kiritimatiellales bacterium]VGO22132.1 Choline-sulfatase [Pontiella sulfatireligans]